MPPRKRRDTSPPAKPAKPTPAKAKATPAKAKATPAKATPRRAAPVPAAAPVATLPPAPAPASAQAPYAVTAPAPAPYDVPGPKHRRPVRVRTGPGLAERLRTQLAGTPGTLRLLAFVTVVAALAFGVLGALTVRARSHAVSSAQANAEQLVRIQTIRTSLVQADANATNAFLVGGLEPVVRRDTYVRSIATASAAIATASGRNARDAVVLADVNDSLTRYAGLVEAARANNRQGLAVGASYLQQASALLRSDVLPALSKLVADDQARVQAAYDHGAGTGSTLALLALLAVIALAATQLWLIRRTKRWINVGLATATGVVALASVIAGGSMLWAQHHSNDVHTGAYAATVELAQARIDAFDAKSAESLTLIARGSGQAYEADFGRVSADAVVQLTAAGNVTSSAGPSANALDAYLRLHKKIRAADDGGDFATAVGLATNNQAGGANAAFAAFDASSTSALDRQAAQLGRGLRSARTPLGLAAAAVLLAGLAAAFAAWRGISLRLQEYR